MELTFTPLRTAIFLILLAAFWGMGGFDTDHLQNRYVTRAWMISIVIFVMGSGMISIVDHWVGTLDRMNLRWLYVVMGVLMIGGSLMYQAVLRERVKIELEAGR